MPAPRLQRQLTAISLWSLISCIVLTYYVSRYPSSELDDGQLVPLRSHHSRYAEESMKRLSNDTAASDHSLALKAPESHADDDSSIEPEEDPEPPSENAISSSPTEMYTADSEAAAKLLQKRIEQWFALGHFDKAKELYRQFQDRYSHSPASKDKAFKKVVTQLLLIGQPAPKEGLSTVKHWFDTPGDDIDVNAAPVAPPGKSAWFHGGPILLYFWELWCPHCRKHLREMQQIYEAYSHLGLHVVGLTKMSRGVKERSVLQLLARNMVRFPMGKESGDLSKKFAVRGIPAVAVLHNGSIVWRGHPAHLKNSTIQYLMR